MFIDRLPIAVIYSFAYLFCLLITGGHGYILQYTRTAIHLMPSPYKTNCFDYNKIGCKSKSDCIDQCNIKWALNNCNGTLPSNTIIDRRNEKNKFEQEKCDDTHKRFCAKNYKSPDCINEHYKIKLIDDKKFNEMAIHKEIDKLLNDVNQTIYKSNNTKAKADINLLSYIQFQFYNEPDTIYTHSPQQHPIEFICFIGGVISS